MKNMRQVHIQCLLGMAEIVTKSCEILAQIMINVVLQKYSHRDPHTAHCYTEYQYYIHKPQL